MNVIRNILTISLFLLLLSCADYKIEKTDEIEKKYYSSQGFALIYEDYFYDEGLINKKLKNSEIVVMHSFLKKNTPIRVINPSNEKFVETKISNRAEYPKIYNIVISAKIANLLELDNENPYVEILEFKKNKTFIAKESTTFDEEKHVATKVPVNEIKMDILTETNSEIKEESKTKENHFVIIVSDFYYLSSANNLKKHLKKETQINKFLIKKIAENKYRLSIGPFRNFKALKSSYISLNKLGFNELDIIYEK